MSLSTNKILFSLELSMNHLTEFIYMQISEGSQNELNFIHNQLLLFAAFLKIL